jgi:hypothetical protein
MMGMHILLQELNSGNPRKNNGRPIKLTFEALYRLFCECACVVIFDIHKLSPEFVCNVSSGWAQIGQAMTP